MKLLDLQYIYQRFCFFPTMGLGFWEVGEKFFTGGGVGWGWRLKLSHDSYLAPRTKFRTLESYTYRVVQIES